MKQQVGKSIRYLLHEFHRLQLMIYLIVISYFLLDYIGLGDGSAWRYRWHKANTVATAVIIAHFAWSQLIYYWDNKETLLHSDPVSDAIVYGNSAAIKAAGMMVFRGIFYYAVIMAYSSGL